MRSIVPLLAATLLAATPVAAQTPSAADVLFEQGRAALAAGNLDVACTKFADSDRLDPAAGTRGSLGECEERRGRVASAWHAYRTALDLLPAGDARVAVLKQRMAQLKPKIPHLVLTLTAGPWDTVVLDGSVTIGDRATFGTPIPLDPGAHHLVVDAPGRAPVSLEVNLLAGQTTQIGVSAGPNLGPTPGLTKAPAVAPRAPNAPPPSRGPWIVGGVGVVGLIVGAVAGGLTLAKKSVANAHCDDAARTCDAAGRAAASAGRTLGPVSTVGLVVGAVGVAAGVTWYAVGRPSQQHAAVGPVIVAGGAGFGMEGAW